MTTLFERELNDKSIARLFAQEQLIEEAAELIVATMQRHGVSKSELAHRTGTSKANVTQLLAGSRNMTLRTFADLMHAMRERVLLTSLCLTDADGPNAICWAVKAPTQTIPHSWDNSELLIGAAGQAA